MGLIFYTLIGLYLVEITVDVMVMLCYPQLAKGFNYCMYPCMSGTCFAVAVNCQIHHLWFSAFMYGVYSVCWAWLWWHDDDSRRRRRKLRDRLARRIRERGGRLTVVQPAEASS